MYYMGIVTRKYQITIPTEVRKSLNIRIGDRVEIVRNERGEFVLKKVERNVDEYIQVLEDAAGALKMDKEKLKEIQEAIGESFHV
jgi:AbrB family looped-hinge helix DNA binding protein